MKTLALALAIFLAGCTTVPVSVGGLGLCVGVCRFEIKVRQPPPAHSAAEQIANGVAGLAYDYFTKGKK